MPDRIGNALAGQLQNTFSPSRLISDAASATGANFDFLMRTAARESNFDAGARASTSSASGMFQFIEQTWLAMVARHGERHGYGDMAASVRQDGSRFVVDDPARRREILDMRFDPRAASLMAGELTAENAAILRSATGREPTTGELYAAHFLGASRAARLIETAHTNPDMRADALFPDAASANRRVFFDGARPRSASELLSFLTRERPLANVPDTVTAPRTVADAQAGASLQRVRENLRAGVSGYATGGAPGAVLSPAVVEILNTLDMPLRSRGRRP
ncbi:MAG: hypothetical protein ACXIVO_07950 [Glycocaulis sp.]|uniref:hypothetical protein n=1 Tax=Glycocaulis sp. TaxID=1969725 RepID=UPI003F7243E0